MHNNYYFLKRLCPELAENITGYTISQCFSQNKNELIIILSKGKKTFTIKAYLHSTFCCLSFPTSFQRSRKNNIDLFSPIINKTIVSVEQYKNERAFCFWLSDQSQLIFKMHGNRSNILWSVNDEVHQIFNNRLVKDLNIIPSQLHRPIDQSKGAFLATSANLKKLFPTFGKEIAQHLTSKGFDNANDSHQWDIIQDTVNELQTNDFYYSSLKFSLFSLENSFTNSSPIQAVTDFFVSYISQNQLSLEKGRVANILEKKISSTRAYITKASKKLQEIESRASYQVMADVIMANLHSIAKGMKEVTLSNFYDQQRPISIKLKEHLSPQKNAEGLYRKARNQSIEKQKLSINIRKKDELLQNVKAELNELNTLDNLKTLRKYVKQKNLIIETDNEVKNNPYHEYTLGEFKIWVGKNAISNDKMLRLAFKDDLWLHAKDVSGSHVLIKYNSNKAFNNHVKEKAAELAAFYSKRKYDSLCPVIVTQKKYVRKRKGDPPGAVVVDQEEVLLVEPNKWV